MNKPKEKPENEVEEVVVEDSGPTEPPDDKPVNTNVNQRPKGFGR